MFFFNLCGHVWALYIGRRGVKGSFCGVWIAYPDGSASFFFVWLCENLSAMDMQSAYDAYATTIIVALTHSCSSSLFFIALHVRKETQLTRVQKVSQTSSKLFVSNIFFQSQVKWPLKQTPSAIGQIHPASNEIVGKLHRQFPSHPNTSFQSWQKPLMTRDTASSGARPRLVRYSNLTQSIRQLGDSWAKQYTSERHNPVLLAFLAICQ